MMFGASFVITHPRPNFNGALAKLPLKVGRGWVITSYRNYDCNYLSYLTAAVLANLLVKEALGMYHLW